MTNLPRSVSAQKVVDMTYVRRDQEKQIQQMGAGLAAWRMPVAEFDGNSAWLEIARLAWNLAKWLAQLALPDETVRWEWKRFRQAFVYVAAQVLRRGRQITVGPSASHRWHEALVAAHVCLQTWPTVCAGPPDYSNKRAVGGTGRGTPTKRGPQDAVRRPRTAKVVGEGGDRSRRGARPLTVEHRKLSWTPLTPPAGLLLHEPLPAQLGRPAVCWLTWPGLLGLLGGQGGKVGWRQRLLRADHFLLSLILSRGGGGPGRSGLLLC